jgi:hypothetical protein
MSAKSANLAPNGAWVQSRPALPDQSASLTAAGRRKNLPRQSQIKLFREIFTLLIWPFLS